MYHTEVLVSLSSSPKLTRPTNAVSARIVQKQLPRGSSAVGGQEVESMYAHCTMWDWEGTLLDLSVEGVVPSPEFLILKRRIFVHCLSLKFISITKRCLSGSMCVENKTCFLNKPLYLKEITEK